MCYNAFMDILIQNVTVLDGSGAPAYAGAIGWHGNAILVSNRVEVTAHGWVEDALDERTLSRS